MDFAALIDALQKDGGRMADVAEQVDPDTPVPSCPDWLVRDLVHHTGRVHRWAGLMVSESRMIPPSDISEILPTGWPSDEKLVDWFREGLAQLVAILHDAPPDLECWTIAGAPFPRDFWTRRQAHETSIHRVDTELAGGVHSGFDPEYAADGIDELLVWFICRPGRGPSAPHDMTLGVSAADAGQDWTVTFGPRTAQGRRGMNEADCKVTGRASDLYPFLWSRTPLQDLQVEGDPTVLHQWRESSAF